MQYKIFTSGNYLKIIASDNQQYSGLLKDIFIEKNNLNRNIYKIHNVKDFDHKKAIKIEDILKEDGSPYTLDEWETFYENFNMPQASGITYSTEETLTNDVWIDQKPIYSIIVEATELMQDGAIQHNLGVETYIASEGFVNVGYIGNLNTALGRYTLRPNSIEEINFNDIETVDYVYFKLKYTKLN